jgi:hypothetical protein
MGSKTGVREPTWNGRCGCMLVMAAACTCPVGGSARRCVTAGTDLWKDQGQVMGQKFRRNQTEMCRGVGAGRLHTEP